MALLFIDSGLRIVIVISFLFMLVTISPTNCLANRNGGKFADSASTLIDLPFLYCSKYLVKFLLTLGAEILTECKCVFLRSECNDYLEQK